MSFINCAISPSGAHRAAGNGSALILDNHETIDGNGGILFLRCYDLADQAVALWKRNDAVGTACLVQTGGQFPMTLRELGPTYGNNPVAAYSTGEGLMLVWLSDGLTGQQVLLRADGTMGTQTTWTPRPFASQGIRDAWSATDIEWFDEYLYINVGPYQLANWRRFPGSDTMFIGAANTAGVPVGTYFWDGLALWTVLPGFTPQAPQISEGNGAAISGETNGFVPAAFWTRYIPQPTPDPIPPTIAPFTGKKFVGPWPSRGDTPAANPNMARENCYVDIPDASPRFSLWPNQYQHDQHILATIWNSEEAHGELSLTDPIVYMDISRVAEDAPKLQPWQVVAFNCYPEPGESRGDFHERIFDAAIECLPRRCILVGACWNRSTLTDQEVFNGLALVRDFAEAHDYCLGVLLFGIERGRPQGQFKDSYQAVADQFSAPAGVPDLPQPPVPPIPPNPEPPMYQTFKSEAEKKQYCNDLAPIIAVRTKTPLGHVADSGLIDPQGQQVWQSFDQWYAVQPPNTVPPADVMLDLTIDRMTGTISDAQLQAVLKQERPLQQ